MSAVKAFLCVWLALVVDATWFQLPGIQGAAPNLVLVTLVILASVQGARRALIMGVLVGLIEDAVYGPFLGLDSLAYGAVGYFAAVLVEQFLHRNLLVTFLATCVLTFAQEWFDAGLTYMLGMAALGLRSVLAASLWHMLVNGLALLVLYPLLRVWLTPRRRSRYSDGAEQPNAS
ncbi:MAG: rod shape-determining protein MreD [Thermoflavifilum sp.]|nr:rod shape-determining protein MreD [Thermoflavifilum sp.]MCL6513972.1 rod shape-determining protein MreD [Alicyclobacillus sp.]